MDPRHYFIAVAPRERVTAAATAGYIEISQGRAAPLARMHEGDVVLFYSPREAATGGPALQQFTAMAEVGPGGVFEGEPRHTVAERPFRRSGKFRPVHAAPIRPLLDALDFIRDKRHWGVALRHGFVQISASDFRHIAHAMGCMQPAEQAAAAGAA